MDSLVREITNLLHQGFAKGSVPHLSTVLVGAYLITATPILIWASALVLRSNKDSGSLKAPPAEQAGSSPSPEGILKLIRSRRSVFPKDYTGELVDKAVLESMLEAANWAPTHGKTEPWRFVVFNRSAFKELFDLTSKVLASSEAPSAATRLAKFQSKRDLFARKSSHLIAICMKRQPKDGKMMPEWEEVAAVACSVHSMHLVATSRGVAGYWSSWYAESLVMPEMRTYLGLEGEDRCLGFFFVGKCEESVMSGYRAHRGPIQSKVTWKE